MAILSHLNKIVYIMSDNKYVNWFTPCAIFKMNVDIPIQFKYSRFCKFPLLLILAHGPNK